MADLHPLREADEPCPHCGGVGEICSARPDCNGTKGEACRRDDALGRCEGGSIYTPEGRAWCIECHGTGRVPGDPDAPKVIEVGFDPWDKVWHVWTADEERRSLCPDECDGFPTPEDALAAAREALGERDD